MCCNVNGIQNLWIYDDFEIYGLKESTEKIFWHILINKLHELAETHVLRHLCMTLEHNFLWSLDLFHEYSSQICAYL